MTFKTTLLVLLLAGLGHHAAGLDADRTLRISGTHHVFSSAVNATDHHTIEEYCYRPGQYAVLDSLLCTFFIIPGGGPAVYYTTYCQTQIIQTDSLTTIYDYTIRGAQGNLNRRSVLEIDQWGRKIRQQEYNSNNVLISQVNWFFPPGPSTQADSVVTFAPGYQTGYHKKYVFSYDQFGRKSTVGLWTSAGEDWIYQGYYENQYSGSLPFAIDTQQPPLDFYQDLFAMFPLLLDESACIISYTFNPVSGDPVTFSLQCETNGQVRYTGQWSGSYEWSLELAFGGTGKISFRSLAYWVSEVESVEGTQYTDQYFWEDVPVGNSDQSQTPGLSACRVFPNPFKETVTIAADGKGAADVYVYNLRGQLVRIIHGTADTDAVWDGTDLQNEPVAAGIYLIMINQNGRNNWLKALKTR